MEFRDTKSSVENVAEKPNGNNTFEKMAPGKISMESDFADKAPEKIGIQHETNSNADAGENRLYSTYEKRIDQAGKSKCEWTGKIGESKLKPENAEAKAELAKFGKDGIEYKNGIPDFSPFAKDSVQIDKMTANRPDNYKQAYEKFAEKWNEQGFEGKSDWDLRSVQQYKKEHNYDMHECSDMKTMQLVPHSIHMEAKHIGGRYECSVRDGERSKFDV